MWCYIAGPSEYLAITGGSIEVDVKVAKAALIWSNQKCVKFNVSPVDYTFEIVRFFHPAVFTIGPQVTNHKSLLLYAKHFAFQVEPSVHLKDLIKGIIKGQSHILDTSVTFQHILEEVPVEQILEEVLGKFFSKLQLELNQFGLVISKAHRFNFFALIELIVIHEFHVYARKTKMNGKVGAGQTKPNVVKIDFDTNARMKVKVDVGQTKPNAVKPDFETEAKMRVKVDAGQTKHNAVKTDLETKLIATGVRKVEIKETTTRVVKIFK